MVKSCELTIAATVVGDDDYDAEDNDGDDEGVDEDIDDVKERYVWWAKRRRKGKDAEAREIASTL